MEGSYMLLSFCVGVAYQKDSRGLHVWPNLWGPTMTKWNVGSVSWDVLESLHLKHAYLWSKLDKVLKGQYLR